MSYLTKTLGSYDVHLGILYSIRYVAYVHATLIECYVLVTVWNHFICDGEYRGLIRDLPHELSWALPRSLAYIQSPSYLSSAIGRLRSLYGKLHGPLVEQLVLQYLIINSDL